MMADTSTEVLFDRHRQGVFLYLLRIVGQAETARDLTQEVFLRVTRARPPEAEPSALRAWIFTIARNLARNHVRDGARRPEAVELADPPSAASQETAAMLHEALGALPALDRDIFLLREKLGLSYDEIALSCDLTPDGVRSRLHRARQQLRTSLSTGAASRARIAVKLTLPK